MEVGHVRYFSEFNFGTRRIHKRKLKKVTPTQYVFKGYNDCSEWRVKKGKVCVLGDNKISLMPDTEESRNKYELQESKAALSNIINNISRKQYSFNTDNIELAIEKGKEFFDLINE